MNKILVSAGVASSIAGLCSESWSPSTSTVRILRRYCRGGAIILGSGASSGVVENDGWVAPSCVALRWSSTGIVIRNISSSSTVEPMKLRTRTMNR